MLRDYKVCVLFQQGGEQAGSHLDTLPWGDSPVFFLVVLREDSGLIGWGHQTPASLMLGALGISR